jgi:hypothetical protein
MNVLTSVPLLTRQILEHMYLRSLMCALPTLSETVPSANRVPNCLRLYTLLHLLLLIGQTETGPDCLHTPVIVVCTPCAGLQTLWRVV